MSKFRPLFFILLLVSIASLTIILINQRVQPPFSRSFSPLFQELGKPVYSANRIISRVVPIDEIDEKILGEEIRERVATNSKPKNPNDELTVTYLNSLVASINDGSNKPFDYEVFLVQGLPNAFAMPGGTICITQDLLDILESEAELVSILGHEIGHIERGHLFDLMRAEMLRRKVKELTILALVDEIFHIVSSVTYSKNQEDEADEYGFRLLVEKGYDPYAMSRAFKRIKDDSDISQDGIDPINDFFTTHPHIEHRIAKFYNRAKKWQEENPNNKRYIGIENFNTHQTSFEIKYPNDWVTF